MAKSLNILIVEARFYEDIADLLADGAISALEEARADYERLEVPGALEIPGTIKQASKSGRYDGYVALGCVLRGETSHYDIVAGESARALMDLTIQQDLAIGNGILTCDNRDQAMVRADPGQKNKGRDAVNAALALLDITLKTGKQ